MEQIRCSVYENHNMNGEIVDGYLKLDIINYDSEMESIYSEIYLSVEEVNNLIYQLESTLQILNKR